MSESDASIFDDSDDEVVFMTSDNAEEMLGRFAKPYQFPAEPGRPREGFMVRMATMANLQAFHSQQKLRNNDREVFKALCKLIADSVVDHVTGEPIWSSSNIEAIARSNVSRFNRMAEAVYDRNDIKKMPAMIEDAEKN